MRIQTVEIRYFKEIITLLFVFSSMMGIFAQTSTELQAPTLAGFSPAINKSANDSDASFIGEDGGDYAGTSMTIPGDINGDGLDDFLILARYDEEGNTDPSGQVYIFFGDPSGWAKDTSLDAADASFIGDLVGTDSYTMEGEVVGLGDINDDGFADFAISSPYFNASQGRVYLIYGRDSGWAKNMRITTMDATFYGEDQGDLAGFYLAGVGDVNDDGIDDFMIGAVNDETIYGQVDAGSSYLFFGKPTKWSGNVSLSTADASFVGEDADDKAGVVARAGDVNNDGIDDLFIGASGDEEGGAATRRGQVYLFYGKATGWTINTDMNTANASFIGEEVSTYTGDNIQGIGDFNGDNIDDFIISAHFSWKAGIYSGEVYLMLGNPQGWKMNMSLSNANMSILGIDAWDNFGLGLSAPGDINGDGLADFIIGAYQQGPGPTTNHNGTVHIIYGRKTFGGMNTSITYASDLAWFGEDKGDKIGYFCQDGKGDVNGDGINDYFFMTPFDNESTNVANTGQVYLVFGTVEELATPMPSIIRLNTEQPMVQITWDPIVGAMGYYIYQYDTPINETNFALATLFKDLNGQSNTTLNITIDSETSWYLAGIAYNSKGTSKISGSVFIGLFNVDDNNWLDTLQSYAPFFFIGSIGILAAAILILKRAKK